MNPVIPVAIGSALGGVARYAASVALADQSRYFPFGTLLINVVGGFLIGVVARGVSNDPGNVIRLFLAIGFCGGFTTFSAFSLETVRLIEAGGHGRAAVYVLASVGLSVVGVWLGLAAGRLLAQPAG